MVHVPGARNMLMHTHAILHIHTGYLMQDTGHTGYLLAEATY